MIDQKTCTQDASDRFDFLIGAITVSFALFVIFLLIPVGVETTTYHSQLSPGFFLKKFFTKPYRYLYYLMFYSIKKDINQFGPTSNQPKALK